MFLGVRGKWLKDCDLSNKMRFHIFKVLILLLALSSVASANMCRSIFLSEGVNQITGLWHEVDGNSSVRSLIGGTEINTFVRDSIKNARSTIELQTLKLSDDIAVLLIQKASEGVKVHIQITDVQSLNASADRRQNTMNAIQRLKDTGIVVDQYDSASLQRHTPLPSPDMHKKLLVVDGEKAYVGNKNFNNYEQSLEFGVAIQGESALALRSGFFKDLMHSQKRTDYLNEVLEVAASTQVRFFGTHQLKPHLIKQIKEAKKSITLAQVEFNDPDMTAALIAAKKANPNLLIQILTGKNIKTYEVGSWKFQRPLNVDVLTKLQKELIEVYEVEIQSSEKLFFHGKLTVIDGERVILGSSDLNRRSLEGNAELDVEVRAPLLATEFESFILANKATKPYAPQFSKKELRTAKYYKLLTDLIVRLNNVKRMTVDKVQISPENMKLTLQRNFGVLVRWMTKVGFSYRSTTIRDMSEVTKTLRDRLISAEYFDKNIKLQDGEVLLFVGSTPYYAETSLRWGLQETKNGRYGRGYYLASDIQTALDYSHLRIKQTSKGPQDLHVLVYKVKDINLEGNSVDAVFVPAALGLGQDYIVLRSLEKAQPFALLKVRDEK